MMISKAFEYMTPKTINFILQKHSLQHLLTHSNDGFPQSQVLHTCLNLMGGKTSALMKQVHKIFGYSPNNKVKCYPK